MRTCSHTHMRRAVSRAVQSRPKPSKVTALPYPEPSKAIQSPQPSAAAAKVAATVVTTIGGCRSCSSRCPCRTGRGAGGGSPPPFTQRKDMMHVLTNRPTDAQTCAQTCAQTSYSLRSRGYSLRSCRCSLTLLALLALPARCACTASARFARTAR